MMPRRFLVPPRPTLNLAARRNMARLSRLAARLERPALLNIGRGDRFLGEEAIAAGAFGRVLSLDLVRYPGVSVLGDAHRLPFRSGSFGAVVGQAVLEHTEDPFAVVAEIGRVLRPGGLVYVEVPFLQGFHPSPGDFYRFTEQGLARLMSPFARIDAGLCAGPGSALCWLLGACAASLAEVLFGEGAPARAAASAAAWLTWPVKHLDRLLGRGPAARSAASGLYFLGEKR